MRFREHQFFGANGEPTSEWYEVVGRFKKKATDFWKYYEAISSVDPSTLTPELRKKRAQLMDRFSGLRSNVERITQAIDYIYSFFGGEDNNVGELGIIPLIPIAVIASAVAAMGYLVNDAAQYYEKVGVYKDALNRGLPPERAAKVAEKVEGGFFSQLGGGVTTAALGVAALFVLPQLLKGSK